LNGEVNKVGKSDYNEGLTIADVAVLANGFTAAASNAKIELTQEEK
jgi:protein involved in polysaccharide export with SLBB domain